RNRCLSEFSTCLSNLLSAGVPITSALETCSRALSNGVYRSSVAEAANVTKSGNLLTTALFPVELWPAEFVSAVEVGEKTGTLDQALKRYADYARENYVRAVEAFALWLPKIIYGFISIYVIYLIISMYYGLYLKPINDLLPNQ